MMKMKVNKSKLFKIAHAILRKAQVSTWSEALKAAWKAMKVYTRMLTGRVEFTFRKVNGEVRKAVGTLYDLNYVAKGSGGNADKNADVICFWDCEKQSFRSFKAITLI
ncbi:MAG: SH3 beta-barrel fold-containing protein [Muribaculaceae bacterium]|nr:SH3 beta-barrel fold-containing protein [Muribaculaceae bacterium]